MTTKNRKSKEKNIFEEQIQKLKLFQAVSTGLFYGDHAYFKSGWNVMDGTLVIVSLIDTRYALS